MSWAKRSSLGGRGQRPPREPAAEELTPELLEKQIEHSRTICLRLLADSPRTRAELAATLARRGVAQEVIDVVLDRFSEVGLIDDALFAKAWVGSRHRGRGLGRSALGLELHRKGVDSDLIGVALSELDPATEEATARSLVARRMRKIHGPPETVIRKLVGMLARKGYPPGLAFRIVKEAMEQSELDAELLDPDAFDDHEHDSLP